MGIEIVIFWISVLALTQLLITTLLAYALGLIWFIILLQIVLFFNFDLDLLASALLAIYSSVFLFLTLLSVHTTPYWSYAIKNPFKQNQNFVFLIIVLVFIATLQPGLYFDTYSQFLWQDLYVFEKDLFNQSAGLLHWFFYKIFILDTILLNLYLCIGLIVAVAILALSKTWATSSSLNSIIMQARKNQNIFSARSSNIKLVSQFRRQTRRHNNSIIRFKI